jgi:hypothetical protein
MIRLRPHRVGKAESLFVANLKPFFDSIGQKLPWHALSRMALLSHIADIEQLGASCVDLETAVEPAPSSNLSSVSTVSGVVCDASCL